MVAPETNQVVGSRLREIGETEVEPAQKPTEEPALAREVHGGGDLVHGPLGGHRLARRRLVELIGHIVDLALARYAG